MKAVKLVHGQEVNKVYGPESYLLLVDEQQSEQIMRVTDPEVAEFIMRAVNDHALLVGLLNEWVGKAERKDGLIERTIAALSVIRLA